MSKTIIKLTKGAQYDVDALVFDSWVDSGSLPINPEGYHYANYFRDGVYLGADEEGVEPTFDADSVDVEAAPFGDLHDYYTAEYIRPATEEERTDSRNAGPEGVISVDGRSVYVQE